MRTARTLAFARSPRTAPTRRSQGGVVLFIALIVLVAMTLAGLAAMRSSGSAILTAGNLAFRQNATVAGDRGIEEAVAWLRTKGPGTLENPSAADGYYATFNDQIPPLAPGEQFDPMLWGKTNWQKADRAKLVGTDAAGNEVRFVIHRLCTINGPVSAPGQECVTLKDPGAAASKGGVAYGEKALAGTSAPYYRITARIDGPKNTVSIVQAMMY